MRLRQSNKKKHFGLPDYGLDLDTSDADSTLPRVDSSEDDFVVDAAADGDEEEEEEVDEVQSERGGGRSGGGNDDADFDDDDFDEPPARRSGSSAAKAAKIAKAKAKSKITRPSKQDQFDKSEHTFAEVPPYPSDPGQRWTRTYLGPIKRWTRFYELIDWWFGDKSDHRATLDGYLKLWWHNELIPPKLTSQSHLLAAQNGWMPKGFADHQRSKFRQLYNDRLVHQVRKQNSTRIDKDRAFRWFVPQAQGELSLLLGHVSDQKPYRIQYGESISFSDTGHPINNADDEEVVAGGWLLDVGGSPVSMVWAPAQGQVNQLLAIAVTPFSDQAYYQNPKDAPGELEQKEGAIQILSFEAVKDRQGIYRPSRRAPRLARALCFSWGRVSRMQWCPVQLGTEDTTRLLGVLCVDSKLRIIAVQIVSNSDEIFEEIEEPMITLEPPIEYSIEITCFTWINMNRVAAGLSDGEKTLKVKLFQHEFCAPPSSMAQRDEREANPRGVSRILHGFLPEPNTHPTGVKMAETQRLNREKNAKDGEAKNNGKGKAKGKPVKSQPMTSGQQDGEVDEEAAMTSGPGPIVLYEPQTRITAVAWNPNAEFSWWAAAAMGSGLVRVMDVGAEPQAKQQGDGMSDLDEDEHGPSMDAVEEDADEEDMEEDGDIEMRD
ncbi:hypothetical protein GQX73_g8591 [Xylaria multiplex]|uniref:Uncharacterized protein n=1 Tax=Xylaria multiplex TaxID=323545 RepID=A0A7C8IJ75_9PEZI|nr:hypothetical protein GQX73_g8591 [Xylaria multiplex]